MVKSSSTKEVKKSTRTTITVPAEDYEELERIAEKKKVSVAWVVREAVHRFLTAEAPLFRRGR